MQNTAQAKDRSNIVIENLKERYARVPRPVIKAKGLSFRAKCVYMLLLDYARDNDACFPSQEQLAEDLDTSVDTIQRALQELKDYGLIDWKRKGYNQPNVYYILRLSDCPNLRIVSSGPQQAQQEDTAGVPPTQEQESGHGTAQSCGSNETKSKETHYNETNSSKKAQSEGDELRVNYSRAEHAARRNPGEEGQTGKAPTSFSRNSGSTPQMNPSTPHVAVASKNEVSWLGEMDRRSGPRLKKAQQERPLPFVGKPLTQEEIDARRREGKNASGYTPLPGLIPPDHWQKLEADARHAPIEPTATHYNHCTKKAPLFIDITLGQFTEFLGDEPENTAQNINRAAKLYRQLEMSEEDFRAKLYEAFDQARRYPTASIQKKRSDDRANRMPVFFAILEERATQE
jgi:biotin operon repressor